MAIQYLKSLQNSLVKDCSSLKNKKYRDEKRLYKVEGDSLLYECIERCMQIENIFVYSDYYMKHRTEIDNIGLAYKVYICDEAVMDKISELDSYPNIVFTVRMTDIHLEGIKKGSYIILEDVQNPGNVGAVIRTAAAFEIDGVIVSGGCDIYSGKVIRGSMGASLNKNVISADNIEDAILRLKEEGVRIVAAVLNPSSKSLIEYKFNGPTAVIIGNEGNGVTKKTIDLCDDSIYIDISKNVESLNASIAASVIMWEMKKQRDAI